MRGACESTCIRETLVRLPRVSDLISPTLSENMVSSATIPKVRSYQIRFFLRRVQDPYYTIDDDVPYPLHSV